MINWSPYDNIYRPQIIGPGLWPPLVNRDPPTIVNIGGNTMDYPYKIRKVKNGFVLMVNTEELVFNNATDMLACILDHIQPKEEKNE